MAFSVNWLGVNAFDSDTNQFLDEVSRDRPGVCPTAAPTAPHHLQSPGSHLHPPSKAHNSAETHLQAKRCTYVCLQCHGWGSHENGGSKMGTEIASFSGLS